MATLMGITNNSGRLSLPLAQLAFYSDRAFVLCDLLESMADDLPKKRPKKWRSAVVQSSVTLPRYYQMIAGVLIPVLLEKSEPNTEIQGFLGRLQSDYLDEESCLPELQALLSEAKTINLKPMSPEAIGYALRSFFQSIRRQTIWEKEVLLPYACRHLTGSDLERIRGTLEQINEPQFPTTIRS